MKNLFLFSLAVILAAPLRADLISDIAPMPLTPVEGAAVKSDKIHDILLLFTPYNLQRPREPHRVTLVGDRRVYFADEPAGQFLVQFIGQDYQSPGVKLVLEVMQGDKVVGSKTVSSLVQPKYSLLVNIADLPIGKYHLHAHLEGGQQFQAIPDWDFEKTSARHKVVSIPRDGIPLQVLPQTHEPNGSWPITTGIPLPRGTAATTDGFALFENGRQIPAQFSVRAWWYPNHTQIKWLGLDFLARYDKGKPREYRLKLVRNPSAPKTPLKMTESADAFAVDTGKIAFTINRKHFAGIENVLLSGKQFVRGGGGPYLVDEKGERYEAANDANASVDIVERGSERVTIRATGWYTSTHAEKLCIFKTYISAYANQTEVHVEHATILTYDTHKEKRLADVGFAVPTENASRWLIGADGKTIPGELPANDSVWIEQDRWDHYRLNQGDKQLGEGKQADGWAAAMLNNGSMLVSVRNLAQLYPKELELARDATTLHFWPRHGHIAYTEQEELDRHNIHKIYYAHQGQLLDLNLPSRYDEAMTKIGKMAERQQENANEANGQGMAIGNDFCLSFRANNDTTGLAQHAALFNAPPHAIAAPAWNAATEVEGRFLPADRKKFPNVEKVLIDGFYGSHESSVQASNAYGMWIWPDTHNNWEPATLLPEWHRIWLNTHYQGGWVDWLMYLRSGDERVYRWACDNTDHILNVSTVNYDDPKAPLFGHIAGSMYHVKGFLPWGSESYGHPKEDDYLEISGHFINPDAFVIRWLLLGDPRSKELMEEWGSRAVNRVSLAPERSREEDTTLGELLSYYTTTWDAQALLHIKDLADEMMSRPVAEIPAAPAHAFFEQQWARRYWELTRDARLPAWVKEYADSHGNTVGMPNIDELLWRWTGDKNYLAKDIPGISTTWQNLYFNPGEVFDGYGLGCVDRSWVPQQMAYFAQAVVDAGMTIPLADESKAVPEKEIVSLPKKKEYCPWGSPIRNYGGMISYLQPKGAEPVVQLKMSQPVGQYLTNNVFSTYIRIEDANGKILFEGDILNGAQHSTAAITLDARVQKSPWKFYKAGSWVSVNWDGAAEALFIGPNVEAVAKAAMAKTP